MIFRFLSAIFLSILLCVQSASAQQVVWVQIEAQPSLANAQERIRDYAARLPDVNGFSLGGGWYGIALGPYTAEDADQVLRVYRAERSIPNDSYIAFSSSFQQQFWPVGANLLNLPAVSAPAAETTPQTVAVPAAPQAPEPQAADETRSQARASEAALSRPEREALQIALKWAGFYDSAIDGAFGRGTRSSMAAWQAEKGYEETGILTTLQRVALLKDYNSVLDGLDLKIVQDSAAGIEMKLPMGVVKFDKYEPPFAHYTPTGDIDARVLLISQEGDQNTLFGLYDIMQTLEIVPLSGPRNRDNNSFVLVGEAATFISYTEASLKNGMVKGFTLIWPAGDEERRTRLLGEMRASFNPMEGALDPAAGSNQDQHIDLVSGLEIRKPKLARSGFYVDAAGSVVTTIDAIQSCGRITIEHDYDAELVVSDDTLGIALLRPKEPLAPMSFARFQAAIPRLQSDIAVSGYSYEGILDAPSVTFGKLADLRGLRGEETLKRLAISTLPGDSGGPLLDAGGDVLGMLLPAPKSGASLPEDVNFAADGAAILTLLKQAGLAPAVTDTLTQKDPIDVSADGSAMTVLVSCWD